MRLAERERERGGGKREKEWKEGSSVGFLINSIFSGREIYRNVCSLSLSLSPPSPLSHRGMMLVKEEAEGRRRNDFLFRALETLSPAGIITQFRGGIISSRERGGGNTDSCC